MTRHRTLASLVATCHLEEPLQAYLARHQQILPAALGLPRVWTSGGPDAAGSAAFQLPKFKLGNEFITDFAVVVCRSFHLEVILVELEPPSAKPFTRAGDLAKRLNQGFRQLNDWFAWLDQPANSSYFRQALWNAAGLSFPGKVMPLVNPFTEYYYGKIVIGRRSMFTPSDNARRASLYKTTGRRVEVIPYDRLIHAETMLTKLGFEGYEQKFRAAWKRTRLRQFEK